VNGQIGLVRIDVQQHRSVPVCGIRGELDASNVDDVLSQVVAAVPNDAPGLALDLTNTEYLDSAGVRILFELARRLRTRRQELRIVVPPDGLVRRVLVLTALADVVPIDDSVAEAADSLQARA
jgi:anti-anti-sigma factor